MSPLSREEVKKQLLILEFYDEFDLDEFGAFLYSRLKSAGLSGGKLTKYEGSRDITLVMHYQVGNEVQKEQVQLNVFDIFGESRLKPRIRKCINDYFTRKFGRDYTDILADYNKFKERKRIREYVPAEELLLNPW